MASVNAVVPAVQAVGNLNEIPDQIVEISGLNGAGRVGALDWTCIDKDVLRVQKGDHVGEGHRGNKAEIGRAGRRPQRFGLGLMSRLVQVDVLVAKNERFSITAKAEDTESQ